MRKIGTLALIGGMTIGMLAAHGEVSKKTERTWKAKCASCHGADGKAQTEQGKKLAINDYTTAEWHAGRTDAQLKTAILEGVHTQKNGVKQDMDGYKDSITPEQADELVQLIRSLKK